WFFQAMEKMKYVTIMNVFSKLLFTVLVFVIIKNKEDYIYQPVVNALGFLVSGCISLWMIVYKFHVILKIPSLSKIWMSIKALLLHKPYVNNAIKE
ncbi:hypothetical protein EZS27_019311, partial [termite gut metagenome]